MKRKFSNDDVYEHYEKTNHFIYFNKEDLNTIVPKYSKNKMRKGFNLNFANPKSYSLIIFIWVLVLSAMLLIN